MSERHPFSREGLNAHLAGVEQDGETMEKLTQWVVKPHNVLYFCGNVGTGKSYFAAAWYNHLRELNKSVRALSCYEFFSALREVMKSNWDWERELVRICENDYFILDDMGNSQMTDWQKDVLFNFLDERTRSHKPTLITSNLRASEIRSQFSDRFNSRLFASRNIVIELNGEDRRQRVKELE